MTERLVDDTSLGADTETPSEPLNNRRDLIRKIALAGAGAAAGTAMLANRADAVATAVKTEQDNPTAVPTTFSYSGTAALPSPGASLVTAAEKLPGPAATDGLALFPAALGGYGIANIKNGVHGSTKALDGFGVVAANAAAATDDTKAAPIAMAVGSFGSHVLFLPPAVVATAAGVSPAPPKVVGPSKGKHIAGELVVDDDYNLWFSIPGAAATDPPVFMLLAGKQLAASAPFVPLATPVRVYDSRNPGNGPINTGQERSIDVTTGKIGTNAAPAVPAGATAGAFNLTVTNTVLSGFLAIFSDDAAFNNTSNINWKAADQDIANFAISAVSAAGKVKIHASGPGSTDFVIDVTGYYL